MAGKVSLKVLRMKLFIVQRQACSMTYKGYSAKIQYSQEDHCFMGHVVGIQDTIGFHADNFAELRKSFEENVDDYITYCAGQGFETF